MEEILNNLVVNEILYETVNGTEYLFIGRSNDLGVIYSINREQKTLPLNTINAAFAAFNNGEEINAQWYINYDQHEYNTRPCNLSVLNELLERI
jgi:hypothetical protein